MEKNPQFSTKRFFSLISFLLICFVSSVNGQNQMMIAGKVTDDSQAPITGATISVQGNPNIGTSTDENGSFSLQVPSLPITLQVAFVGYGKQTIVISKPTTDLVITMKEGQMLLDNIVVSASRKSEKITEAPAAIAVLSAKNIANDVVSHPTQSLRYLTGVHVVDNGNGYPVVALRGAGSPFAQDAYVLIDNRNIITPGFREIAMNRTPLDATDLARVEVVKGAASALYGPGVETGVVNYITKDPFQYKGTTLSTYAGERQSLGFSVRHAGTLLDDKLGYKVTGFYRTMNGFEFDSVNNEDDKIMMRKFIGTASNGKRYIRNSFTNELTDIEIPMYKNESYSMNGFLEYRFSLKTNIAVYFGRTYAAGMTARTSSIDYTKMTNDYASIKFKSGNFWSQFSYMYGNNNSGIGNFLTGTTRFLQGKQYDLQAQYTLNNLPEKWEILLGGDARSLSLNSQSTEYGTFEGNTPVANVGFYVQGKYKVSEQLDVLSTIRYDYFEEVTRGYLAPRLAIVYKPLKDHSIRLTFNQAVGAFEAGQLYNQNVVGGPPDYSVRIWGVKNGLDWNTNNVRLFSRLGGTRTNGITNLGFNEAINFGTTASNLSTDVINYLKSLNLTGGSNIVLKVNNVGSPISIDQIYKKPVTNNDPNKLEASTSRMYELGYNGTFDKKLNVTADFWLMQRSNFFSNPQIVSPIASAPAMVSDLKTALSAAADPARLAQLGVTIDQIANAIGNQYITRFGVIDIATLQNDTKPSVLNTFVQGADLDYWGIDLGLRYDLNETLTFFGNYAYLSNNQFNAVLSGNENTGLTYYLMQPQHKVKLGATYNTEQGFNASIGIIHNTGFDSPIGNATIQKIITPYTVIDAGIGYNFGNGLKVNITTSNLLNQYYRALPQWTQTGRLALLKATYEFGTKK